MIYTAGLTPGSTGGSFLLYVLRYFLLICLCLMSLGGSARAAEPQTAALDWQELSVPAPETAGKYAVLQNQLLFVSADNCIFTLTGPEATWQQADLVPDEEWSTLFQQLKQGASLQSTTAGVICSGGTSAEVCLIRASDGRLQLSALPRLPDLIQQSACAVLNDVLYLLGQLENSANSKGWSIDVSADTQQQRKWQEWQLPARQLQQPVLRVQNGSLYLLQKQASEVYLYKKQGDWQPVSSAPRSTFSQPALNLGPSHFLLPADSAEGHDLLYHTITDTWRIAPFSLKPTAEQTRDALQSACNWQEGVLLVYPEALFWGHSRRLSQGFQTADLIVLGLYSVMLIAMSVYFARRNQNCQEYFLAGQRIPWWAAGLSLLGSSLSAITFMAFPAMSFRTNWVYLLGNFMILAVAPLVIWFYLPFYRRLKVTTAYEYLEHRFGLPTRLVGSSAFLLFQLGRMGVVVYLPALALSTVSSWDVYTCILVIGCVATLYTTLGGIEAVIWTDVIQVLVLIGGALISLFVILSKIPSGMESAISASLSAGKLHAVNYSWDVASTGIGVVIVGNLFKFLIPYSSDQGVIQRYLTTSDERQAARGIWLNAAASIPVWTLFFALGTGLWVFYRASPERLDPLGRTDEIFAWFIVHELPAGVSGLVIAGLFAASMSSLDTSLNSMATAITADFYQSLRPQATDRSALRLARWLTVLLGIFGTLTAIYLARANTQSIWDQFLKIMGLFGGGLAGMFIAGIFTRRTTQTGVLLGFSLSAFVLYQVQLRGTVHFFLYGAIGILTCALSGWLFSLLLPQSRKQIEGLTIYTLKPPGSGEADLKQSDSAD
ncbi:MAG: sodium:solute symporter [Gimesia sp.]|mgnify:CR=1 FL=1|nr:sodium:solute symporter [Gimesia sp.]